MTSNNFRELLFPIDNPRLAAARGMDYRAFGEAAASHPLIGPLVKGWRERAAEAFKGITSDGTIEAGLFRLTDEGAPVAKMTAAADALLGLLTDKERGALMYPVDAPQWRFWSNPEFLVHPNGLRLEDLETPKRDAVMQVVSASLSERGYRKACGCMRTNAFLGHLCGLENIMNEWSYNFLLFGVPSMDQPWGWSLYGHHLALNCLVLGGQMVISPTFMGAEPNIIDSGPHAGLSLFNCEEVVGLELMRSLPTEMRDRARTYREMHDPAMPADRWNFADQRHLGGAFQDNRIIPYEGVRASEFDQRQKTMLMSIIESFIEYLPQGPLDARLSQIEAELDRTWWSWIGEWGDEDPFYYRIQSPLIMVEFDHHSGVWLANEEPAKCHIHTVVRTPNGNDYGKDILRQHYEQVHPGRAPGRE